MRDELIVKFEEIYKEKPEMHVSAPGRINLIGEHTDYNEGFVLPAAIDRKVEITAKKRSDHQVTVHAIKFNEDASFQLDNIQFDNTRTWSNYERGVADILQKEGYELTGVDMVIGGDIPLEAGLSSSAAVEVASIVMFNGMNNLSIPEIELIKMAQKAENEFVGMKCGIMDQFISCLGKKDNALFIDCKTLDYNYVPLKIKDAKIVISNTKVKRQLVTSEYNKRREECEKGVEFFKQFLPGINSLRDIPKSEFEKHKEKLPEITAMRCEHVIFENDRVLKSLEVLKDNKLEEFGELLYGSHYSLKDLYEVSCDELDIMVEIARSVRGVYGSRMVGAGFGGCTITLVHNDSVEELQNRIMKEYFEKTGIQPELYICSSEEGARFEYIK